MKILLVDCDASVLQYLERLFRNEGSEVTSVLYENQDCSARIMDMARVQQFQTAFVNLLMPSLSGVELSGRIKRVSPRTRIILMSTPASTASRARLLSCGVASEFFIEPSALQELREILRSPWHEQHDDAHSPLENAPGSGSTASLSN